MGTLYITPTKSATQIPIHSIRVFVTASIKARLLRFSIGISAYLPSIWATRMGIPALLRRE